MAGERAGLVFVVVAVLCAMAALSCSKQGKSQVRVIVFNCPANALEIAALEKEIPAFERRSGIRIELNPFAGDDKLYAMVAAGKAPDIFYTNSVVRDKLASEGRLLDLRGVAAGDPWVDRLEPRAVEGGRSVDGGWYSLTNWEFTCGVYYNRELFDREGIPYPDSSWSWEQMTAAAARLTKDANADGVPDRYGIFIGSHFIECLELMNHAPIARNTLLLSISPESRQAYEMYLDLVRRGWMPDTRRMQAMGMQAPQLLGSGKVAMLVEAVPNTNLMESLKIRWGVAPLPRMNGKEPLYFRSRSGGLSISAGAANRDAAWKALKWIVSEASIYQPNPVLRDADFAREWEVRHPSVRGTGFADVWNASARHNGGDPRYFVRFSSWTMQPIMERFQPLLDQLWAGRINVEQIVSSVDEINRAAVADLRRTLATQRMAEPFRKNLEDQLAKISL